ncbi:pyruvate dehydrogenase (quinone) [Filimonas zeae]|uniref:Pyruvate dehydrogenase n=1 Tax=Filimonas zeae TaxID=1737353 RepID=A0A917J0F8_9BACT|nr:thiamine pyrophosphate-dependent enzyme [Filimonas zeae]MDR6340719.1 pyruvate dehydrogenase (quinone) [Filimonas zeae]GGH74049.1 pyruvate dehydrogenase [Filimonas zeae]
MATSVSEQLVNMLSASGVERIYAVTGDSLNHVNDAIRRDGSIQWIHVRHEETAAYAAGAEAQLTGKLACCAGSCGPGHVHLINGLYDAHRSGAPVLAIASTIATQEFGSEYFQETQTGKLFDDCSHYNQVATTPGQVPRMLQMAMQHAVSRKGVSVLGLPGDVTEMKAADNITTNTVFTTRAGIVPDVKELQQLAALLNAASKITIFCGIGVEDAHAEVVALAELLKAPVGYSFRGKMAIQHNNPNEVGMTGLLGLPSAYHAMHHAELILLLGTDFPYTPFIPEDLKIVQIEAKAERLGRRAQLNLGLQGTVKETLLALKPYLEAKTDDSFLQQELKVYADVKQKLLTYVEDWGSEHKIHPEYVAHTIDRLATSNAIFTVDTGMTCVWAARYLHATGTRHLLGSFNHGSMANALPQAIGAALCQPQRQVIALCGDGGLSMSTGDLATIVQYKLPVKVMVFNNHSLGMVKLEMQVAGLPDWQTDMVNPDFAILAGAYGIPALTVNKPEDVEAAIQKALQTDGPFLLNIITDPAALAMPPKIDAKQIKGMTLSMARLMLHGQFDEVWDTITSNIKHAKELL